MHPGHPGIRLADFLRHLERALQQPLTDPSPPAEVEHRLRISCASVARRLHVGCVLVAPGPNLKFQQLPWVSGPGCAITH